MATENYHVPAKDEEELELEKLVFGDQSGFEANLRKIENLYSYSDEDEAESPSVSAEEDNDASEQEEDLFFIDDAPTEGVAHVADNEDAMDIDTHDSEDEVAWVDSDDDKTTITVTTDRLKKLRHTQEERRLSGSAYVARLRAQYEKIYPRPEWADNWDQQSDTDEETFSDEDEEDAKVSANTGSLMQILSNTRSFVKSEHKLLPPHKIEISRLKDANIVRRSRSGIHSMNFHPSHPLLITGGNDKTLRIYHIDGKSNQFVSSIHFRDMPISTVQFSPLAESSLVYAGGKKKFMHRWDLATGDVEKISRLYGQDKYQDFYDRFKVSPKGTYVALVGNSGWINFISGTTGQFVKGFRIDGTVADLVFSKDEQLLIVSNKGGDIWEFAVESSSKKIVKKWTDTGAVSVTSIQLGGAGDRWFAVGTKSGIVNLFDRTTFDAVASPKPFKEITNLVTSVTCMSFSPDGQVLSISSKDKKDALRLVHLPSGTVFSNWPTSGTPLGRVTTAEFTPNGQMLAIGNDTGKVTLWRLNHY